MAARPLPVTFRMPRPALAAALAVLLAGCAATLPEPPPGVGVVVPGQGNPLPPGANPVDIQPGAPITPAPPAGEPAPVPETRPPLNPNLPRSIEASGAAAPVISLVKSARAALRAGRTAEAGASLERALRIEPRNPWVWQALSGLHVITQQGEQAESEAKKSMSLGKRNPYLDVENWRLIAEARRIKGDKAGAIEAERRREDLQRFIAP